MKGYLWFVWWVVEITPRPPWVWVSAWAPWCPLLALAAGLVWRCATAHGGTLLIILHVAVDATVQFSSPMHTRMAVARAIVGPVREAVALPAGYLARLIASALVCEALVLWWLLVSTSIQSGTGIVAFSLFWTEMHLSLMSDPFYACEYGSEWPGGLEDTFVLAAVAYMVGSAIGTMQARGADVLTRCYAWFFALLFAFTYVAWASCAMASSAVAIECDVRPVERPGGFAGSFVNSFVRIDFSKLIPKTNGSATANHNAGGDDDKHTKYVQW